MKSLPVLREALVPLLFSHVWGEAKGKICYLHNSEDGYFSSLADMNGLSCLCRSSRLWNHPYLRREHVTERFWWIWNEKLAQTTKLCFNRNFQDLWKGKANVLGGTAITEIAHSERSSGRGRKSRQQQVGHSGPEGSSLHRVYLCDAGWGPEPNDVAWGFPSQGAEVASIHPCLYSKKQIGRIKKNHGRR